MQVINNFNPRSPCGERRRRYRQPLTISRISTHAPRAGSDGGVNIGGIRHLISTHAPRAGSDDMDAATCPALSKFQPTLPVRGATRLAICKR